MSDTVSNLANAIQNSEDGQTLTWYRGNTPIDMSTVTNITGTILPFRGNARPIDGNFVIDTGNNNFQWAYDGLDTSTTGYHLVQFEITTNTSFVFYSEPIPWYVSRDISV